MEVWSRLGVIFAGFLGLFDKAKKAVLKPFEWFATLAKYAAFARATLAASATADRYAEAVNRRYTMMHVFKGLLVFGLIAVAVSAPAAAATNESLTINWEEIGNIVEGAGSIMPSIGSLIVAVVPVVLVLIVVGFVTGIFESIISAIRDAFRFIR
jgi:hypothetical protein